MRKFFLGLLSVVVTVAQAVSFNQSVVPAGETLAQTLQQAYTQVLVRITGNPQVMTIPAIRASLLQAKQYVVSFRYQKNPNLFSSAHRVMVATFDMQAIKQLLLQTGQPIWPAQRVKSILWLDGPVGFLSSSSTSPEYYVVKRVLAARGVPTLLPAMDLTDQTAISAQNMFQTSTFVAASKRYAVQSMILGKISQHASGWQGRWLWYRNGVEIPWQNQAASPQAVITKGLNQLANLMGNHYALLAELTSRQGVLLKINGVNNVRAFAKLQQVVSGLAPVTRLSVQANNGQSVVLRVRVVGDAAQLVRALKASQHFKAGLPVQGVLQYQWVKG